MPGQPWRVKVPMPRSTFYLHECKKRTFTIHVRALFTPKRDNEARLKSVRFSMRRAFAMLGLGTAVFFAAASLTLLPNGTQASSAEATFMVPAADGYGIAECLISNRACGQVVADTWCEAQGYTKAVSFRQITPDEATGSVQKVSLASQEPPVAITCAN
jgi:hypothetical protein